MLPRPHRTLCLAPGRQHLPRVPVLPSSCMWHEGRLLGALRGQPQPLVAQTVSSCAQCLCLGLPILAGFPKFPSTSVPDFLRSSENFVLRTSVTQIQRHGWLGTERSEGPAHLSGSGLPRAGLWACQAHWCPGPWQPRGGPLWDLALSSPGATQGWSCF